MTVTGSRIINKLDERTLADVPVFPLPHVVLFPEARLPLHIFEPRYRKMLADCMEAGGALVIAQVDSRSGRIADIASVGIVVEHEPLPDGRSNIVVSGAARVHLAELVAEDPPRYPYKRARATRLRDLEVTVNDAECTALLTAASMFAAEVKRHDPSFTFRLPPRRDDEGASAPASLLADVCAFQLVVDASVRQAILEELDPRARVRLVMDQLALQHGAMLAETKDASDVAPGRVLN
jgi:Lon protease-like protein